MVWFLGILGHHDSVGWSLALSNRPARDWLVGFAKQYTMVTSFVSKLIRASGGKPFSWRSIVIWAFDHVFFKRRR